jgi:hypothetical protein
MDAVNGPVALVYERIVPWAPPGPPSYVLVAQSNQIFSVAAGIRIENVDPMRNLVLASLSSGPTGSIGLIGAAQPNPARQFLTPLNQSGSISPRILVPADVPYSVTFQHQGLGAQSLASPVTFPRGFRWRLSLPGGALVQTL